MPDDWAVTCRHETRASWPAWGSSHPSHGSSRVTPRWTAAPSSHHDKVQWLVHLGDGVEVVIVAFCRLTLGLKIFKIKSWEKKKSQKMLLDFKLPLEKLCKTEGQTAWLDQKIDWKISGLFRSIMHLMTNMSILCIFKISQGLPRWLSGKESTCNAGDAGDLGSLPGSVISPGGGHSNPLQDSCLGNPTDREAWWATVHTVTKSQTWLKRLSIHRQGQSGLHNKSGQN